MLQEKLDNIVSFHASMFPVLNGQDVTSLALFTEEERASIRARVHHFQQSKANNVSSRKGTDASLIGGSALLKELEHIEITKRDLMKWVGNIKEILAPKEVTRTTIADAKRQAEQDSVTRLAASYAPMQEKQLRALAEVILGDVHLEFTVEELPLAIAIKQIAGVVPEAGKVL